MGGMCSKSRRSTVDDVTVNNAPSGSIPPANGHSNNESRDDVNEGIPHLSRALSQKNRSTNLSRLLQSTWNHKPIHIELLWSFYSKECNNQSEDGKVLQGYQLMSPYILC
ncbi:unnamed protein product [Prunus armeniaca]|uniref:Uncharacterized protein n=1 Tax=Prunus armeniaca TaxID=36596 RepID=A0A6J5Y1C5_PRUAR|nr:unnamed protein product [Prunus armeniaca]